MSYANDITSPEVEIAGDASGSSFFSDAKNRYSDLKAMLDGNKDNLKMEAMKRIINMIARGKDVSELFPAVVKNVAAKNLELKKLVYVYLVRYAEEQQDLALLSISTFQRGLKDPNQLIRASALRVLSSIRVPMIAPIMMLAIKESLRDMSPYVRKVSAHAIPKLYSKNYYSLDPDQKEQLIEAIDQLLADKTTLVVGSAVYAFEELCPKRADIIHKYYRKLCQLLIDVDEWSQVVIINMLTRYARTQFVDPNAADDDEADGNNGKFYSSTEEEESDEEGQSDDSEEKKEETTKKPYVMDPDLRMLLKNTKPLLQSRNSAVVLAVAQLYYHLAPRSEVSVIAKALVRLLRSHREVQSVVLTNIATISAKRKVFNDLFAISKNMFEPFLKSFFVRSSDPTHIKLLKLEILTNLATQTNISFILREFQTYVQTHDKEFAASAIDAIGRCAANINEVTDVCLSGLVQLMSTKNETVVAQSVVVIKRLLQMRPSEHKDILVSMAKLIDTVKIPAARASIMWLIGEYCETVPDVAPDVLRKTAKTFTNEEETVKMQILNLAVKLLLTNREQTELLVGYVFTLAKYDQSYDLRDRARLLRNLVMPATPNPLTERARHIFLTNKPAPVLESTFKDRDQYQLGTLSHYLNQRCDGYNDLPDFPDEPPEGDVRNVEGYGLPQPMADGGSQRLYDGGVLGASDAVGLPPVGTRHDKFYSDDDSDEESDEDEDEESGSEESTEESSELSADEKAISTSKQKGHRRKRDESEEESSSEEEVSSSAEETSSEEEPTPPPSQKTKKDKPVSKPTATASKKDLGKKKKDTANNVDLLLDLDFGGSTTVPAVGGGGDAVPPPTSAGPLLPSAISDQPTKSTTKQHRLADLDQLQTAPAQFVPSRTCSLVDRVTGQGLSVDYRFTRSPSLFSNRMCSLEIQIANGSDASIENVKLVEKKLQAGMSVAGLNSSGVMTLNSQQSSALVIGVDFADTTQAVNIDVEWGDGKRQSVSINAPVGEQLEPLLMSALQFKQEMSRLSGLNETSGRLKLADNLSLSNEKELSMKVYDAANVIQTEASDERVTFAGRTLSNKSPLLISVTSVAGTNEVKLTVNCEKMVIGSMLFKLLKTALI